METIEKNRGDEQQPGADTKAEFASMLHAGTLTKNGKTKKLAAQYSLSLIKASLDYLINTTSEGKIPDVNATLAVMKEFASKDVNKEIQDKYPCSNEMLKELIKDHERIIVQLHKTMMSYYERYRDLNIKSFLHGIIEEHKTIAGTLKRYLVGQY
jgi:hypothetical protein